MPFDDLAILRSVDCPHGRARYVLVRDLVYELQLAPESMLRVEIPAGTLTDLASTPRWAWPVFPPSGQWNRAAILHDYLCSESVDCGRFLADALFRVAMADVGVPVWRRTIMYFAVRLYSTWLALLGGDR